MVDNNGIKARGAISIAQFLDDNETLVSLDLGNNKIDSEGAVQIFEALKNNLTLISLSLCNSFTLT